MREDRIPLPVPLVREAGAGAYTEITSVEVPASAVAGSMVTVRVTIKNRHSSEIGIMVGGALEYGVIPWPVISFPNNWANFPAGVSFYFDGTFRMPDNDTIIHAHSYYYTAQGWVFDDEKTRKVTVSVEQPAFSKLSVIYTRV